MREDLMVAVDGLLELGYEAAADLLTDRDPDFTEDKWWWARAKDALENFEAGAPSIHLDTFAVYRRPMHSIPATETRRAIVIAKAVGQSARPWYRFVVGVPGRYDRTQEIAFQSRHKTLREAKEGVRY